MSTPTRASLLNDERLYLHDISNTRASLLGNVSLTQRVLSQYKTREFGIHVSTPEAASLPGNVPLTQRVLSQYY